MALKASKPWSLATKKLFAENFVHLQNKRSHNLGTLECINMKIGALLEISLLMTCRKTSRLPPKNLGSSQKVATK